MMSRNDKAEQTPVDRYMQMEEYKENESTRWPFRNGSAIKVFILSGMAFQTQEAPIERNITFLHWKCNKETVQTLIVD